MQPNAIHRSTYALLVFLALSIGATCALARAGDERIHLVVLHTNDVHGQVVPRPATWLEQPEPPLAGGLARVAAAIRRTRAEVEGEGGFVLVLDAGDWFQGTPEGALEDGRPFLAAMKEVGYDALCVGNHEFDRGIGVLLEHLAAIELPALLANVSTESERFAGLPGTRPSLSFERGGLAILVVGLLTPATPSIAPPARELVFHDAALTLARVAETEGEEADLVIALTHLGVEDDRRLARALPWLELVVGGHSHSFLAQGEREGRALIVQAGSKASAVGRVDLWFDPTSHELVEKRATTLSLLEEPTAEERNQAVSAACERLVARVDEHMAAEVGILASPLERARERFASSPAGNWITDCMRARTGADVAVHNKGGIRADLPAGRVTRRALFDIAPFDNALVTLTLRGAELEALLRRTVESKAHSGLEISGVVVELRIRSGRAELARVLVAGEPLEAERGYRLTTNSFLASGGDGYEELSGVAERTEDPIVLRELLEECMKSAGTVHPSGEGRWRVIE